MVSIRPGELKGGWVQALLQLSYGSYSSRLELNQARRPPSRREMPVEVRVLEYLLRVVEHGSLNRAAEELRLSQPSLSRWLNLLEH